MNARERFLATLRFEPVDRPFRWETLGMWPETLDRWYSEGLDPSFKQPQPGDRGAIAQDEYQRVLVHGFGFDRVDYLRHAVASGYTDSPFCPAFEREVLSEDEDTRTILDADGIVKREIKGYSTSSMPQFVRHPVHTQDDFHRLLDRLDPDHPDRLSPDWADQCAFYRERDFPAGLTVCGAFGHPRNLFGLEELCVAYHEQPMLIHEITHALGTRSHRQVLTVDQLLELSVEVGRIPVERDALYNVIDESRAATAPSSVLGPAAGPRRES